MTRGGERNGDVGRSYMTSSNRFFIMLSDMYHRWGVLAVVIDGVVSECENENYDCYSRMEYRSLPRNYVLSLTLS